MNEEVRNVNVATHIPVMGERAEVTKKDVVTEEIVVGRRKVTDTEKVSDTIRREEADIQGTTHNLDEPLHRTDPGH